MTKICKLRIAGGNGNPANAGRECDCTHPRECPIGPGSGPPGPEQDVDTMRIRKVTYERGYCDGRRGHPPAELTSDYVQGYAEGRKT